MKKVLFMPTPFLLLKGVLSGAEGEGVLFLVRIPSALVMCGIGHQKSRGASLFSMRISHEPGLKIGSAFT